MKRKKRGYVWVSLLLMCGLCVPRQDIVWANEETEDQGTELSVNMISDGEMDGENAVHNDEGILSEDKEEDIIDGKEVVQDEGSFSDNEDEAEDSLSENEVLPVQPQQNSSIVSENQSDDEEPEDVFHVSLPTEIPFSITLVGKERRKGMIRSERFCIANKGDEDIIISFNGICSVDDDEKYVISDDSVTEKIVHEKNVWMYLEWEDENGEALEQTGITMGDAESPGKGEIVLKASKRDKNGTIIENDQGSKIYFSFTGDLNAGTNGAWKGDELRVGLEYSITEVSSTNMAVYEADRDGETSSADVEVSEQFGQENDSLDVLSDNVGISDNVEITDEAESIVNVSDNNADEFDEKESISDNLAVGEEEDIPEEEENDVDVID